MKWIFRFKCTGYPSLRDFLVDDLPPLLILVLLWVLTLVLDLP